MLRYERYRTDSGLDGLKQIRRFRAERLPESKKIMIFSGGESVRFFGSCKK